MIAALFLVAAAPAAANVVEAELAFARDAQEIGQWTAFRRHADSNAIMFTPRPRRVRDVLTDQEDPKQSIRWWPTEAYVSCDGQLGVTTGPWIRPDGKTHGYFTTVWKRTTAGWHWIYDSGARLDGPVPVPAKATLRTAQCKSAPRGRSAEQTEAKTDRGAGDPGDSGYGTSPDGTLRWSWNVDKDGARHLRVDQWNGTRFIAVLANDVAVHTR